MRVPRRPLALFAALFLYAGAVHARQAPAPPISPEAMEAFLLNAELSDIRGAGAGVTDSLRATASDGRLTHDVHIQAVDDRRSGIIVAGRAELNFRDSYNYNIAAYRLAVLLGMDSVPMSVRRAVRGVPAAVTWWVDDVAMTERERFEQSTLGPNPAVTAQQFYGMYVFDELIQNRDRNRGNALWTSDWKLWLIDHTRAFRPDVELTRPERLSRIGRDLLEGLRQLTPEALDAAMDGVLDRPLRSAVIQRRDLLVQHFDERIARLGEAAVVIDP
ncbi:MAG: hypothetical protein J4F30_01545 [Acidobacteria bacterium]|nr:hypothetical protein [Acidobacteriota bacterium]